ncbi:MAG TPA: alpha-glucosidase [Clostridiales bacterium]|nr:alpha-glucosidase [Clostridiales bacterium]
MEARNWWKEAVVYQIYPRSFMDSNGDGIGDLKGIISKLDYLKDLGVDVIWLSPVYQSPNDDNGYDISDYYSIMGEFGTMEDFDALLDGAHKRGIKIVMDLVVNHTSDRHKWFIESRKSKDNPYRDYYIWREGKDGKEPNNWGSRFRGSAWEYDEETDMYYLHSYSKKQPDLNWENVKVREDIYQMMDWWCQKGIDGFRMDVISMISKDQSFPDGEVKGLYGDFSPYIMNGPKVHDYLKEMNHKVLSRYDLMTVGETIGVTTGEAKKYASCKGDELNMIFQFEHVWLSEGKLGKWTDKKVDLIELKNVMSKWQTELKGKAWNSLYWDNHDQPRAVSRFGNDSTKYRNLSAKMLATCLHMMKGTPYIYQGEELGMTNVRFEKLEDYKDIDTLNTYEEYVSNGLVTKEEMMRYIHCKSRDNARTPMQWNDNSNAGFTAGIPWIKINPNYIDINAEAQVNDPDSVYSYYKKLISLRKQYDIIVYGNYQLLEKDHEKLFIYSRTLGNEKLLILCNFTEDIVDYGPEKEWESATVLIDNYSGVERKSNQLLPYEARVLYSYS